MNITSLLERKLRKCEAICLKLKTNAKLSEENPHQIEYEENMEILSEKNDQWSKQEEMLIRLEKDVSNSQVELTTGNHIDEKSISQLDCAPVRTEGGLDRVDEVVFNKKPSDSTVLGFSIYFNQSKKTSDAVLIFLFVILPM